MRRLIHQNYQYKSITYSISQSQRGCAISESIMGRLISHRNIWRLGNLMAIGIQRPSFQLGKEERA
jgi:hypothetical protein